MAAQIIGIDLGTTRSVMAVMHEGKPVVIPNAEGYRITPSVVAFLPDGSTLVGEAASRQISINPANTIRSVKRFLGRSFDDPEVADERKYVTYNVVPAPNGDVWIEAQGKYYSPTEISALILRKLKSDAEAYIGAAVDSAVVTVPAYFTHQQRRATYEAGALVGLRIPRILNEPTAASLAYGLDSRIDERVVVYDLGGGTFDVTVLELGDGVFEVKSTNGDAHLGGDDFDERIVEWLAAEVQQRSNVDPRIDPQAYHRLREAAEHAKIELSQVLQASITLPFLWADTSGPMHLVTNLTRSKLEELTTDLIGRTLDCVGQALAGAEVIPQHVDKIVLAGGMTRMPAIRERLRAIFRSLPVSAINQEEVVAAGAAIQAGVLTGEVRDVLLLDAISHRIGIEAGDGSVISLIGKNVTIPTQRSRVLLVNSNQRDLDLHVVEGTSNHASQNASLALITIAHAPQKQLIEVTMDLDANQTLVLSTRDYGTDEVVRSAITGTEHRLVRPQPDAMPIAFKAPTDATEINKYISDNALPQDVVSKHKNAWEIASNATLVLADSQSIPLARDQGSWDPSESILKHTFELITLEESTDSQVDILVTSTGDTLAFLEVRGVTKPAYGHSLLILKAVLDLDSAAVMAQLAEYDCHLKLSVYDLYSDKKWESKVDLSRVNSGESRQPRFLPILIQSENHLRAALPPPVRRVRGDSGTLNYIDPQERTSHSAPANYRIFVSHTHADKDYCRRFVSELRASGADVWFDDDMPDGLLLDIVQRELSSRPIFVVILSPDALSRSQWVKLEVNLAFEKMLHDARWHMLPVVGAAIRDQDLDDRWLALKALFRIEQESHIPFPPGEAARQVLWRLSKHIPHQ